MATNLLVTFTLSLLVQLITSRLNFVAVATGVDFTTIVGAA
jgi:hypothetical protein